MKLLNSQLAAVVIAISVLSLATNALVVTKEDIHSEWKSWQQKYQKSYTDEAEEDERFAIWKENREMINKHNIEYQAGRASYSMKMNKFGDMTKMEFKKKYAAPRSARRLSQQKGNRSSISISQLKVMAQSRQLPTFMDWREMGVVNPVKDQGNCGSCYAFSTVASLESHFAIKSGRLYSLSEQQLVDCALDEGDNACHGGLMDYSYDYVIMRGITTEDEYPYTAKLGVCKEDRRKEVLWPHSYVDLPEGDEYALQLAVALIGPVSVAIDAESDFRFPGKGVFTSKLCNSDDTFLDHAVIVVGYGIDRATGKDYWLVRNSWGPNWAEDGYIRMARNDPSNMCGIADFASFPLV